MRLRTRPALVLLTACALTALASEGADAQAGRVLSLRLVPPAFDSAPPFDQRFSIVVTVPAGVTAVTMRYGPAGQALGDPVTRRTAEFYQVGTREQVAFPVEPLDADKAYRFRFEFEPSGGAEPVEITATAAASYRNHFDTDFGVLWSPRPGPAFTGASTNVHFFFVPINPAENPKTYRGISENVWKRLSVFAGLTVIRFASSEEVANLYEPGNLVAGVGVRPQMSGRGERFVNFLRLNAGWIVFRQDDPNPLVDEGYVKASPVFGLTANLQVSDVLAPIAAILGIRR